MLSVVGVEIDPLSRDPSYQQLAALLRAGIRDGTWPPGKPIPSITRLQQETGLAVTTIRRAIGLLEDEGLVVAVPGRGTYVADSGTPRQPGD